MTVREPENLKLSFLKCFACIGVLFIHILFPGRTGEVVSFGSTYAVPCFFMIAGYYAFGANTATIKRRLFKILKIFLIGYLSYFSYFFIYSLANNELSVWLGENFDLFTPAKYICFCTIEFAIHLWYLISMAEVYLMWFFVVKKKKEAFFLKLIPVVFLLQIALTIYCETNDLEWFWKINFITRALPWFLLGYYLHTDKSEKCRKLSNVVLVMLAVVGFVIAVFPFFVNYPVKFNVIGYIPYAFALFTMTLKNPEKSICKPMEFIGAKLSMYIYLFHNLIDEIYRLVCGKALGMNIESAAFMWSRPFAILILSVLASFAIYKIVSLRKNTK